MRYKASLVKSKYFEPQFCSYGLSTTLIMTTFLSGFFSGFFDISICWQIATYFFHTLINMKMLGRIKASISWLHTDIAWVSSATPTGIKNRFWHTVLCRYMSPQGLQTWRWFLRKSLNRLKLLVIISKMHIFDGRESSFALKCSWYWNQLTSFIRCP